MTLVPPDTGILPYRYVGDLKYLDEDGRLIDDASRWHRVKASLTGHLRRIVDVQSEFRRGDFDAVPPDQLADHSPTTYANHLWASITETR